MNNLTRFSVTAPTETLLKKLNKANIPVFNVRKKNSSILFSTHHKYSKKVFAIFSHPCYNINVEVYGFKRGLINFALKRLGVFIGAAIFLAFVWFSNAFVFKIEITGNGAYLQNEIKRIIYQNGVKEFTVFNNQLKPKLTAQILALPQITFCSVQKKGSVLCVDVAADEGFLQSAKSGGLYSDASGVVQNVVALCGTALCSVGDTVNKGDLLIGAYAVVGEQKTTCMAAGFATLLCQSQIDYFAITESPKSLNNALKSINLYAENIVDKSYSVTKNSDGVIYKINFSYLHTISINL